VDSEYAADRQGAEGGKSDSSKKKRGTKGGGNDTEYDEDIDRFNPLRFLGLLLKDMAEDERGKK